MGTSKNLINEVFRRLKTLPIPQVHCSEEIGTPISTYLEVLL